MPKYEYTGSPSFFSLPRESKDSPVETFQLSPGVIEIPARVLKSSYVNRLIRCGLLVPVQIEPQESQAPVLPNLPKS